MEYRITIALDNAAFFDGERHAPGTELRLILQRIAEAQEHSRPWEGAAMDSNGNTVGKAEVLP